MTGPTSAPHPVVALVEHVRRRGPGVPVSSTIALTEALDVLTTGPDGSRTPLAAGDLLHAARATLAASRDEVALVDDAVAAFLSGRPEALVEAAPPTPVALVLDDDPEEDEGEDGGDEPSPDGDEQVVRWSAAEILRARDFAECTPEERAVLDRMIADLGVRRPRRRTHRRRPAPRARGAVALRPTVRDALRHGGEPLLLHRTRRTTRPRRVVLVVDVSGSMEPYSRALLRFAHALARTGPGVEVFALGTRLTRLTDALAVRDPDRALAAVSAEVADWSGGTRLGGLIGELCDTWGRRGTLRGATVVVLSDGWDRGDPAEVSAQMARLHRLAHRVVWVNPLKATPGYAPLARGMAAALPHVDEFVEGHSLDALDELAEVVAR